jgi:predicted metalloprotease with PDZ domain
VEEVKRNTDKYVPNDRFMITVTRPESSPTNGIKLVEYKGEFYVAAVFKDGPFYATAIDIADKVLSINGKKVAKDIKTMEEGLTLMSSKPKITLFVMRLEPKDSGYKWVIENYGEDMEVASDEEDGDLD